MAISIVANRDMPSYGIKEYFLDTEQDLSKLPKDDEVGTAALVIETGSVYLINSEGQWIKFI